MTNSPTNLSFSIQCYVYVDKACFLYSSTFCSSRRAFSSRLSINLSVQFIVYEWSGLFEGWWVSILWSCMKALLDQGNTYLVGLSHDRHFSTYFHSKLHSYIRNYLGPLRAHCHLAVWLTSLFSDMISSHEVCPSLSDGVSIQISLWLLWESQQA